MPLGLCYDGSCSAQARWARCAGKQASSRARTTRGNSVIFSPREVITASVKRVPNVPHPQPPLWSRTPREEHILWSQGARSRVSDLPHGYHRLRTWVPTPRQLRRICGMTVSRPALPAQWQGASRSSRSCTHTAGCDTPEAFERGIRPASHEQRVRRPSHRRQVSSGYVVGVCASS